MNRLRSTPLPAVKLRDALNSAIDALPDGELLDRFTRYADHPAFEVLVRRHGPMVFGVCRRVIGNAADADDAFQASFLVLIRKARSLRRADRLGPWLYGVACRVAMKARSREARRAAYRTEAIDMIPDPTAPAEIPDWLPILDAELNALPAKYRDPLVLCELQGAPRADAAKQLGIPEGTLSSRLARGRELLRKRLLKHGTLLPAGGLAALFTASNVGRATAPAALLSRMCELAKVATGAIPAGAVPVGAARLTDEVLKSMFLTKLRIAGGILALFALATIGLSAAALPSDAPGAPPDKGAKKGAAAPGAKAPATDPKAPELSTAAADKGAGLSDRDAIQGLWVLEKIETGTIVRAEDAHQAKEMVGKMRFLIAGDVWWGMMPGVPHGTMPTRAKLDSTKNPKWVDMDELGGGGVQRAIYELNGDRLRICVGNGADAPRPAEFSADADVPLMVMDFRREKLPPPAGEKALVGSWVGELVANEGNGKTLRLPTKRAEIFDGYLFVFSSEKGRGNDWVGGKYTVDTTKNPKWVDVELVSPLANGKVTKLYGCYEVADGRLKLALGGKRATRPLEFKDEGDVLLFDLAPTKTALVGRPEAPAPKSKAADETIRELMKSGDFAGAEKLLRSQPPARTALAVADEQLMLGVCVLERARAAKPAEAQKLFEEAWARFENASAEASDWPVANEHATRVKTQAQIRGLQVLQHQGKSDRLLTATTAMLDKHRGTVEELILLSLIHHAHKQKQESDKAVEVRGKMKEVFDRLPPAAFTGEKGEYSREYWAKEWFGPKS